MPPPGLAGDLETLCFVRGLVETDLRRRVTAQIGPEQEQEE